MDNTDKWTKFVFKNKRETVVWVLNESYFLKEEIRNFEKIKTDLKSHKENSIKKNVIFIKHKRQQCHICFKKNHNYLKHKINKNFIYFKINITCMLQK